MIFIGLLITANIVFSQAVSCPSGFEVHGESCYLFSHGKETWTGAFDSCKLFGSMLAEINDANENNYITNKLMSIAATNPSARWWIGMTDKQVENEWVWETSKLVMTDGLYSNWGSNEPNGHTNENCVFYGSTNWGDADCSRTEFYICEMDQTLNEIVG